MNRSRDQRPGPHEYPGVAGQFMIAQPHQAGRFTIEPLLDRNRFNSEGPAISRLHGE